MGSLAGGGGGGQRSGRRRAARSAGPSTRIQFINRPRRCLIWCRRARRGAPAAAPGRLALLAMIIILSRTRATNLNLNFSSKRDPSSSWGPEPQGEPFATSSGRRQRRREEEEFWLEIDCH